MAFTLKVLKGFNTVNGRYCCNYNNNKNGMSKAKSFNTVNGEHCYFITFVFPSFQSGTRDVRSSSSLRSSAASHPSSHTVNGKYYSIITFVFPSLRSGTRDVWASSSLCSSAASHPSSHTASGKYCCNNLIASDRNSAFR